MRFNNSGSVRTSTNLLRKREFQKHLMRILDLNINEVENVFEMNKNIFTLPQNRIIHSCMILRKFDVNIRPLTDLQRHLLLNHRTLEHKINVLKDIGVSNINVTLLSGILCLFRTHICKFKEIVNIPAEQSITENIFGRFGNEIPNNIFHLESNDTLTVKKYYQACLLHCKTNIFDLPYLDDRILLNCYGQLKSISMLAETLKLLKINLGFDEEMIKKYPFVITASPENVRSLLNSFDNICGVPIVTFLRNNPNLLFQNVNNLKELLVSLKRYNISDKEIIKNSKILNMDNYIFIERIEMLKRHPDLHIWLKHPRILDMITHIDTIMDHVGFLRVIDRIKWARPHTLLSQRINLEKFLQNDHSIVSSKKSVRYVFSKELGTNSVDLVNMLARHRYWNMVGYAEINQMLKYLKTHFEISDICQNIHLVLYTQSRVEEVLADLKQQYSNSTEYSFTNNQYLALCLYTLEKDNQFTDDGIWNNRCNAKQQSLDPLNLPSSLKGINNDMTISDNIDD